MNTEYRKTKIVCTMGPHLFEKGLVGDLMKAGMNVARFNFSHGTHESHLAFYKEVCRIRDELGLPVATMLDTKGPEIRIGNFPEKKVTLEAGQIFTLTTEDVPGDKTRVSVLYKDLPKDVKPGNRLLIDDGLIGMTIEKVTDTEVICRVENSGTISDHKGVNVPDVHLSMPYISEKDHADILFAVEHGFDYIAASFARSADDIRAIRHVLHEAGDHDIRIIAKIENKEGINNIDDILRVSDALMVARGDMGVEVPFEEVPALQKMMIRKCVQAGKPVITATQMLDSMMKNPRPTRAEATDVANAIYDGTSAIMLSGETAAGMYPLEAVQTMDRIARRAEHDTEQENGYNIWAEGTRTDVTTAISHATVTSARDLKASAIITVTKSGTTARVISKYRPSCPIVSCTTEIGVWRKMSLSWGVIPLMIPEAENTDDLFEDAVKAAVDAGVLKDGELVVLTAGVPLGISGTTNLMKVHVVGHILATGTPASPGAVTAPIYTMHEGDSLRGFRVGDILVCRQVEREMLPIIRKAAGLILEDPNPNGQGVIAGVSLDIPVIIGAKNACHVLKTGSVVRMDADKGTVSCN